MDNFLNLHERYHFDEFFMHVAFQSIPHGLALNHRQRREREEKNERRGGINFMKSKVKKKKY